MTETGAALSQGILPGNHEQLIDFIRACEGARKTGMVWGAPGIGKTEVIHSYAAMRASELGRELKLWHRLRPNEKMTLFTDPEARKATYLVYDNRAASNDSTDDKGIPNIGNGMYLEWLPNQAYKIFEMEETEGMLFNDELTLAPTLVQNAMYKMVHDHAVGDVSFNERILVLCAGNRVQDQAFVQDTPLPLRTRMIHFWLVPAEDKKQIEHFMLRGVDHRLIGFFAAHPNYIFHNPKNSDEFTACTPRCIVNCSDLIKNLKYPKDKELLQILACGAMSTMVGKLFMNFLKHTKSIDLDMFLKDPSRARNLKGDLDSIYGLLTLVVHRFGAIGKEGEIFDPAMEIFDHLQAVNEAECAILMLRMMKETNDKRFKDSMKLNAKAVKSLQQIAPIVLKAIE